MKALITGATGYTGSYVCKEFLAAGWQVDIIIRPSSLMNMIDGIKSRVGLHVWNGTTEEMMRIVSTSSPDVSVHLASMVVRDHKPSDLTSLIESNILVGVQLLEAMAQAGVKYFINTGTYWEHYQSRDYCPVGLYAASKYSFQNMLQYYVEINKITAITLKLFDAYGPHDPRKKLMNLLLGASKTGEQILMTKGEQKIDLIHVRDVAAAYVASAELLSNGLAQGHEVYGVGSGNRLSIKDVVKVFERVSGRNINIKWGDLPYREREVMDPCRLEVLPGWAPLIELEAGISSMILSNRYE